MPPKKPAATGGAKKPAGAVKKTAAAKPAAKPAQPKEDLHPVEGLTVPLKVAANSIIFGETIHPYLQEVKRWPLLIDSTRRIATFLRHRDCNFLDALDPDSMKEERIRLALIGSLRYGKPLLLDIMDNKDVWKLIAERFDAVQKGILQSILDMSILKEEKYMSLVKTEDGEDYKAHMFLEKDIANFRFAIVTEVEDPSEDLTHRLCSVTIE